MVDHTVKAFDSEIGQLRGLVAEMGGLAEVAIRDAIQALTNHDEELAGQVVAADAKLDALEAEVDRLAVRTIALRAPMADDLRDVIAALKISGVIERIGDYAKNIAKRVNALDGRNKVEPITLVPAMAEIAEGMVRDVLNAYGSRDAALAVEVIRRDQKLDQFYNTLFRSLLTHMMESPSTITVATQLLFIARNLERIGDHATNVAEMVYYAATGEYCTERDSQTDDTGAPE
ncbi:MULTISPECIES: phosphate signaling complex protein PhoU [Novosphingobium]|uniref:Phosphate-specific transport system accessory protein PhoU n=2 Tax=Novosphingobium TaxID=165696 RepID=G6EA19_9SPHN|nr:MULTISPECIES: phosphate signaling complex protein PhoU [Novosphingobium]AIT80837.1 PhoU family transcriptional regulator [Novosphingobium pentaromativorans US6-1]EHJ61876.1 phosphate transport system protein [Novosphingobium pentaromativorans US6-1]CCA91646.1 phosphate transport system protein [Novosphingobium sp. PP1Y]CDO34350.1 transcriptional repressor for high-affinity phosphate uptake [Novosphingobium sp. KN65.2]SLK05115.1 phosphate transport system protein [Novosphingobium mathurense]